MEFCWFGPLLHPHKVTSWSCPAHAGQEIVGLEFALVGLFDKSLCYIAGWVLVLQQ